MSKPKVTYRISELSQGIYELTHGDLALARFSRNNFREVLEKAASDWDFSSKWIGSMLRLFHQTFPSIYPVNVRSNFNRFVEKLKPEGIADYLRCKGFRVVRKIKFDDLQLIGFLEKEGYDVEGFIGNVHYATEKNWLGTLKKP